VVSTHGQASLPKDRRSGRAEASERQQTFSSRVRSFEISRGPSGSRCRLSPRCLEKLVVCLEQGPWVGAEEHPHYSNEWEFETLRSWNRNPNDRHAPADFPVTGTGLGTYSRAMLRYQRTLSAILAGVRAGAFPAVPGEEDGRPGRSFQNCSFCDFHRLCSTRRDDEYESKRGDGASQGWAAVGRAALGEAP
jgi:hypothetical protein